MEFKKYKLGELCRLSSSKRIFESEYVNNGIPFIRGQEISDKSILDEKSKFECYISEERYNEIKDKYGVPQKGDILMTAVGTIGNLVVLNSNRPFYFKDGNVIRFSDFSELIDSTYLALFMKSPYFNKQIQYALIGAVQKALTMVMLSNIEIPLPEISIQKRIATILMEINSKIETNKKINKELEVMAKELYDYWFVQFDFPNEAGKPYKTSGGKMTFNTILKREIPEGWYVTKLCSCIKHINTGLNPRDNFILGNGKIKYITVKNLTTDGIIDFSGCDLINEKARVRVHERSQITKDDILFASISPLGRCYIIQETPEDWDINESVFSIRPDQNIISPEYLYCYLTSEWFMKKAEKEATGSIFAGIRIAALNAMPIIVPDKNIIKAFSSVLRPIFEEKEKLFNEIQYLVMLRDELLPMLMNGQVEVK